MSLTEYKKKRDFDVSPEPEAKASGDQGKKQDPYAVSKPYDANEVPSHP